MDDSLPAGALVSGQRLEHYKGGRYRVVGRATLEATLEPVLVYRAADARLWVRPEARFSDVIEIDGAARPRFRVIAGSGRAAILEQTSRAIDGRALVAEDAVRDVLACYDEPWRAYHDVAHVERIFARARRVLGPSGLSPEQVVALLFHDAIYVPGAPKDSNEFASAALVMQFRRHFHPSIDLARVQALIRDTASHTASGADSALVLDLDLASLASDFPIFLEIAREVRAEYEALLPHDASELERDRVFHRARLAVLEAFERRDRVFLSEAFSDLEAPMRRNVAQYRDWIAEEFAA
jgi:predicted metal-dependent HD superfamily phosphohydrolase